MSFLLVLLACTVPSETEATGPSDACLSAIDAYDARMEAIVAVVAESQPWDNDELDPSTPLPTVDRPLLKRLDRPMFRVELRVDGVYVDGQEVDTTGRELYRKIGDARRRASQLEPQLPMGPPTVESTPETPVSVIQILLDVIHAMDVENVDLVVEREHHTPLPQVAPPPGEEGRLASFRNDPNSLPPLRERLDACPLDPALAKAKSPLERVSAERIYARQALTDCSCAVDPHEFLWAARLRHVPPRLTNVIPVTLPVRLDGATWSEAAVNPITPMPGTLKGKPGDQESHAELLRHLIEKG